MAEVKTFRLGNGTKVTAMIIETFDDVRDLRAAEDWHEGAVAMLTYPTAPPRAYVSLDNPKYFGRAVGLDQVVVKGPAGDFYVLNKAGFLEEAEEVAA
jgi:hypothetical protein